MGQKNCICGAAMDFVGEKQMNLADSRFFMNTSSWSYQQVDLYHCPRCGRLDFYVPGSAAEDAPAAPAWAVPAEGEQENEAQQFYRFHCDDSEKRLRALALDPSLSPACREAAKSILELRFPGAAQAQTSAVREKPYDPER